jgi:hypothetical protein
MCRWRRGEREKRELWGERMCVEFHANPLSKNKPAFNTVLLAPSLDSNFGDAACCAVYPDTTFDATFTSVYVGGTVRLWADP